MRRTLLLAGVLGGLLLASVSTPAAAEPIPVTVTAEPTRIDTVLGGRFTLDTEITNTGSTATGDLLAHLNVASIDGSVYVDPEDWSAERSQELSLQPGESRTLSWEVQAVNPGPFAAYVVVLPFGASVAGSTELVVGPMVTLEVAPRSTLTAGGALPIVLGVPVLLGLVAAATRFRVRRGD